MLLQVLAVVIPLGVAVISSTYRWPTLRRRIRDHIALAKDLPQGVNGEPLQELIDKELAELAAHDQRRLDTREDRRFAILRWTIVVVMVTISVGAGFGPAGAVSTGRLAALLAATYLFVFVTWLFTGVWLRGYIRARKRRRANEQTQD